MSEYSFKSQFGMLSGPEALFVLRLDKTVLTCSSVTLKNSGVSSSKGARAALVICRLLEALGMLN